LQVKKKFPGFSLCAVLASLAAFPVWAQHPDKAPAKSPPAKSAPTSDAPATRQQAQQILDELRAMRLLLEKLASGSGSGNSADAAPAAEVEEGVRVGLGDGLVMGREDAPLTIVEFSDFQCGYCKKFHETAFPELKKNFIDTGKVRFVHRDFPLNIHPQALRGARAGRCAAAQGKFWAMRDLLLRGANALSPELIQDSAKKLNLDAAAFRACLESDRFDASIRLDTRAAILVGADGTPAFVIGPSSKNGVTGVLLIGAHEYVSFEELIGEFFKKREAAAAKP
jgi:protein-disulfide isomerase